MIKSGGQVNYRLGGGHDLSDEQVEYRLGEQNDAREVFWIGNGATAEACGITPGQRVQGADRERVHALMDGVNPATGEVMVVPKVAIAESAKVTAKPGHDAIVKAAAERGCSPIDLFTSKTNRETWTGLAKQVAKGGDVYRTPAAKLAKLGRAAGVDVASSYDRDGWTSALANAGERVQVGTKGFDVGLTLPKRASLALITAPADKREQLKEIANRCATETFNELADRVAYGSTGHQGDGQIADRISGSGLVGTMTMEATSRAGDGHIHYHSMIANMTICEDGKARTIGAGGYDVATHGPWADEMFRMKYRADTERLGLAEWGFDPKTGEYDDLSISDDAKSLASKRHNAIAIEKAGFGPEAGRSVDAMAERITRDGKGEKVETLDEISDRFGAELAANGIALHGPTSLERDPAANHWDAANWQEHLDTTLTEHDAVFTRVQAEAAIMRRLGNGDPEQVNAIADTYLDGAGTLDAVPTMLSQRLNDGERYTTEAMLTAEKTVYETTARGLGQAHHTIDRDQAVMALSVYEAAEGFQLNEGQRAMFLSWTSGGNQVDLTIGAAGTGKTAAADAARYAWESQGLRVLGISTSGLAAQNLGAAAKLDVSTAHGLATAIQEGRAPAVDVLVWDEMGMASTREQAVILPWAAANGVDLRGQGDPKQLDSVGAGSTFGRQCEQVNATELTENMRQDKRHERDAVEQLRSGDTFAAFAIYAEHGQIDVAKTEDERIQSMAAAWAADAALTADPHERMTQAVMLSATNSNAEKLHLAAREEARARGWITGPETAYYGKAGPKTWAEGETVLIRKTLYSSSREPQAEIFNGQRALVTGIDPETRVMSIEWKDAAGQLQTRTLEPGYVAENIAPGTALTRHGSQGQTIRHVHTDLDGADRNGAYVPLTRDTDKVTIYTDLNSLDVHGKERVALLQMSEQQRADWAGRELAQRIEDRGWQLGETAHDATRTAVPMPEHDEPGRAMPEHDEPSDGGQREQSDWLAQANADTWPAPNRDADERARNTERTDLAAATLAHVRDREQVSDRETSEPEQLPYEKRPYRLHSDAELDVSQQGWDNKQQQAIQDREQLPEQIEALRGEHYAATREAAEARQIAEAARADERQTKQDIINQRHEVTASIDQKLHGAARAAEIEARGKGLSPTRRQEFNEARQFRDQLRDDYGTEPPRSAHGPEAERWKKHAVTTDLTKQRGQDPHTEWSQTEKRTKAAERAEVDKTKQELTARQQLDQAQERYESAPERQTEAQRHTENIDQEKRIREHQTPEQRADDDLKRANEREGYARQNSAGHDREAAQWQQRNANRDGYGFGR